MRGVAGLTSQGQAFGRGTPGLAMPRAVPPSRNAGRRRGAPMLLLPALLWIFTQLVMSGFALHPNRALAGGLHSITICTGSELTTIIVDADGRPVSDVPTKTVECPWCAQFGGIGELPRPGPAPRALASGSGRRIALPSARMPTARAPFPHYVIRAPPLSASL